MTALPVCRRGTSNTNARGSAASRRIRKTWLLGWFGDGETCNCYSCATSLVFDTLEVDRIIPGILGGNYTRGNIRPACGPCNRRSGNAVRDAIRRKVPKRSLIRLCRLGLL
jgi:5-methylcytosine-specific restriction endonuclease McrA